MRSASIGTPAAFSSSCCNRRDKSAGFTLLEALVALALVLAFVATLGPYLFHARRIMDRAESRIAAQILLRTLLNAPFDRSLLANAVRGGELNGLHWRIVTEPMAVDAAPPDASQTWAAYRVVVSVSSDAGQMVTAETIRLAKTK